MGTIRFAATAVCAFACACNEPPVDQPANHATAPTPAISVAASPQPTSHHPAAAAGKNTPEVEKALAWLARAQQKDGGFGGGSHAQQEERDAHKVQTDPATTAVAATALLRAGTRFDPNHQAAAGEPLAGVLARATEYLLQAVEAAQDEGPQITDRTGTQPQAKMGANVDTALTAQFLARLLHDLPAGATVRPRVTKALSKCLRKIETAQAVDGSWTAGGWAPVLQSAQMCTALELAQSAGLPVDAAKLAQARAYQKAQVDGGGAVHAEAAAGIALYASAGNMRANVSESKAAADLIAGGKRDGQLDKEAKVDEATLRSLGVDEPQAKVLALAFVMNEAAKQRSFDGELLDGFGNNGGEEFLSYQMKSEALAIDGGEQWAKWQTQIHGRLAKVQNQDGSWSGHHCITSPVFCTATAIASLTADRDVDWLRQTSKLAMK